MKAKTVFSWIPEDQQQALKFLLAPKFSKVKQI
jgi:hypothetical protein